MSTITVRQSFGCSTLLILSRLVSKKPSSRLLVRLTPTVRLSVTVRLRPDRSLVVFQVLSETVSLVPSSPKVLPPWGKMSLHFFLFTTFTKYILDRELSNRQYPLETILPKSYHYPICDIILFNSLFILDFFVTTYNLWENVSQTNTPHSNLTYHISCIFYKITFYNIRIWSPFFTIP